MGKVTALRKREPERSNRATTTDAAEKDHGGGDEGGDEYDDPEDYWQAAYCAALESRAAASICCTVDAVIKFAASCADAALEHYLANEDEVVDDPSPGGN